MGKTIEMKLYQKEYREKNKEKIRESCKQWKEKNKEKVREAGIEWRDKNKDYYKDNIEMKLYKKEWSEKNKEKVRESQRQYREKNKEKIKENSKECYQKRKEYFREKGRKYCKTEMGKISQMNATHRRREIIKSGEKVTREMLIDLLESQNGKCNYCKVSLDFNIKLFVHLDHIFPLSKGGEHKISNLQYLCQKCNLQKSDKEILLGI